MIRYPLRPDVWREMVEDVSAGWLERAEQRTEGFRVAGHFDEPSSIWSQVKRVYMEVQGFKCGFCERRLEKSRYGNVEHDIEHFRPKRAVARWPSEQVRIERGADFPFELGGDADPGYFLLPYHIENYLISCKTCNTALKANAFPIAGARATGGDHPRHLMRTELPFLVYPIGTVDQHDAEDVIRFEGILPVPVAARGHRRRRAEVTIAFFALDSREILLEERAETILALHVAMSSLDDTVESTRAAATLLVERLISPKSPHANCARSFHDLTLRDPGRAGAFATAALDYLESIAD
jgi:hypothetical protein